MTRAWQPETLSAPIDSTIQPAEGRGQRPATVRLLLLAPPGGGKGTQGQRLAADYRVPYIASGELLRDHVARATSIGRRVRPYLDEGTLVPDALVAALVHDRLTTPTPLEGFVLDGFPRNLEQARLADTWEGGGIRLSRVVHLQVTDEEVIRRVTERAKTSGRSDDTPSTLRHRLEVYRTATEPLIGLYHDRGILVEVDGAGGIDEVGARVRRALS